MSPAHQDWEGGRPVLGSLKGSRLGVFSPAEYSFTPGVPGKPESFLLAVLRSGLGRCCTWPLMGQQLQSMPGALERSCLFPAWSGAPLFSMWAWRPCSPTTQLQPICSAGRTLKTNLDALRVFKMFMMSKMGEKAKSKKPPHAGNEKGFPLFPSCYFGSASDCTMPFYPLISFSVCRSL